MNYKYILFDLDGTVMDSAEGITNSVAYALKRWNIEVASNTELQGFVGPPLHASFEKYFGFSPEQALEAVDEYRVYYRKQGIYEQYVYEGIPELLAELRARGKKIILATSKPEDFAKHILEHFGLIHYFDLVAGASMDSSRTKKSLVIEYALEQFGVTDTSECIMVGDRDLDVIGARAHGIDCIGVLYGYGDLTEMEACEAKYIAPAVSDIIKFI